MKIIVQKIILSLMHRRFSPKAIIFRCGALLCLLALLGLCSCQSMEGCGQLKEHIIHGFNDWITQLSHQALTASESLTGERLLGEDDYVGSYAADYNHFNGREILFGGTALTREGGNKLSASYELSVSSGTVRLYWLEQDDEHLIADNDGSGTYHFTIGSGNNYIILEGENFSGSLKLLCQ